MNFEHGQWYCSHCKGKVAGAPASAARSTPEQCPHCKRYGVTWVSNLEMLGGRSGGISVGDVQTS